MKTLFNALLSASLPALFAATLLAANPVSPQNKVQLWNGRDLTGWKLFLKDNAPAPTDVWTAKEGVLHLAGKPNGYLRTEKSFANYHLHVEWRWPANADARSNSGVFVHITGTDAVWPSCIQCNIKVGSTGELIGMGIELPGAPLKNGISRIAKIAAASEKPIGEWNDYDIFCHGDSIEVQVNGVKQNQIEKIPVTSGCIGFQMEGSPMDVRNLWIDPMAWTD